MAFDVSHNLLIQKIRDAESAVDQAGVAIEFRGSAFECVLSSLLNNSPHRIQSSGAISHRENEQPTADEQLSPLALRLNISERQLGTFYRLDGDTVHLIAPTSAFPDTKTETTRQIAVLITAARDALLDEREVDIRYVRDTCENYAVYDSANFMRSLNDGGHLFSVSGRRRSRNRLIKLRQPGWELARKLISNYDESLDSRLESS